MTTPIVIVVIVALLVLVVAMCQWIVGRLWERLRGWLPTPQDPGPSAKPLPTPWRRAPDPRPREAPNNRPQGVPG